MKQQVVTCVGAGNIGRAWAIAFARGDRQVRLHDSSADALERSRGLIDSSLRDLAEAELIGDPGTIAARISFEKDLEQALAGSHHVQENVLENLAAKQEIFAQLDAMTPASTVLATSSSEFMSSQIITGVKNVERVLVAHPFNPPYLIPLVEISGHEQTSTEAIASTQALMIEIGMTPVIIRKEIKAFLLNRLQGAVIAEELFLVEYGYCSAEDLDRAMTNGLALRWSFIGPFMTGHLNASGGYRDYMRDDSFGGTFRRVTGDLASSNGWDYRLVEAISEDLEHTIPTAEIAQGQQWRDRRLMALLKHKAGQPDYK